MPVGDNPHSISEKAALRESPKEPKSSVNQQPGTSPFPKDKATEIVGIKRSQPNGPMSPTNLHMLGSSGTNGHLVYVRRRLDTDQSKGGASGNAESVNPLDLRSTIRGAQEQTLRHQNDVSHIHSAPVFAFPAAAAAANSSLPYGGLQSQHSSGKQSPGKVAFQPNNFVTTILAVTPSNVASNIPVPCSVAATSPTPCDVLDTGPGPKPADPPRSSNQDWKERFIQLQAFMRNNEQSGQEEYIRMLRSLSSVGRSKHAIELEKRAVNLLIEEGKELQKMKVLNILGKLLPTDPPALPTQPTSPMHP